MSNSRAVIWFRVRVPVLSEQMAEVDPSVSTAGKRLMIALRPAISVAPSARMVVITIGIPVGIAAMASVIPSTYRSENDAPQAVRPITIISTNAIPAMLAMMTVKPSTCLVSGDFSSSAASSMPAICPTSVSMPVPVTSISPRPRVTLVFI